MPAYSDSFCLSYSVCPFLLNLSPSWDACPIFPNVPSSSLTLLHFPALPGQGACLQTKCFSSHLLGKPHHDSDSSSGIRFGCCATIHGAAYTNTGQHLSASPSTAFPQGRNTGTKPAVTPFNIIKEVNWHGSLKNWFYLHEIWVRKHKPGYICGVHSCIAASGRPSTDENSPWIPTASWMCPTIPKQNLNEQYLLWTPETRHCLTAV